LGNLPEILFLCCSAGLNPISMQPVLQFLTRLTSNFYLGTSLLFLVWITFFDGNDLVTLFSNQMKLRETEAEIGYYKDQIEKVRKEQVRLQGNPDALERFARERFLMKKDDEEVFIFLEEKDKSMFDRLIGF
jgi:cell division protein DivIC